MEWLNIHRADLDSAAFVGSDPLDRSTWLCLFAYCCGQENGGVIVACEPWSDRKWQQLARVTLREVKRTCDLWSWEDGNLTVRFYPVDKEKEIQAKREAGKKRAAIRWGAAAPAIDQATAQASSSVDSSAISSTQKELDAEGKGRKGKEREGKKEGAADAAVSGELPLEPTFPQAIDTPEFRTAWADWIAYRRERKLPTYKPTGLAAQLSTLAEWGPDAAIASIRESIRQQWQGLFAPKALLGRPSMSGPVPWQRKTAQIDHTKGF